MNSSVASTTAAAAASARERYQVPRILLVVVGIGILVALNRVSPALVAAVLLLVVLYIALTHADQVGELVGRVPAGLASLYNVRSPGEAAITRGPAPAVR